MEIRRVLIAAFCAVTAAGCSSTGAEAGSGGGPEPLQVTRMYVDADGRTVHATINCGGTFRVKETTAQVTITYIAPDIALGARSCAIVRVKAVLATPLAGRTLVDGVDHTRIPVFALTALAKPSPGIATASGEPSWSAGIACPELNGLAVDVPCGAQAYSLPGVAAPVTLVQDLATTDPPYNANPVPSEQLAPWCMRRDMPGTGTCGTVTCQPVAGPTDMAVCDAPHGRFARYVTWLHGGYRFYLASAPPVDPMVLARVAETVA